MTSQSMLRWLRSIENENGYEILLVQTVRNALMGASVVVSASLVAIIGVISVGRAFSGGGSDAMAYAHVVISASSVMLAVSLTEALLALRALARVGFGFGYRQHDGGVPSSANTVNTEFSSPEQFARYLAAAMRQLSRASVNLAIGMAVAVIGGIMLA